MPIKTIEDLLKLHEGYRTKAYRDSKGILTIGVGFNIGQIGLYPEEIQFMLDFRIGLAQEALERSFPWFNELDEVRKAVLLDMCYNLGIDTLKQFRNTLAYIKDGQYSQAAVNMRKSLWASQVGQRAVRLSKMMETGQWPES